MLMRVAGRAPCVPAATSLPCPRHAGRAEVEKICTGRTLWLHDLSPRRALYGETAGSGPMVRTLHPGFADVQDPLRACQGVVTIPSVSVTDGPVARALWHRRSGCGRTLGAGGHGELERSAIPMADGASRNGADRDGLRRIADFARAGLTRVGVDAVAVTFANEFANLEVLYATDDLAERAAQMEFVLGEGPNLDAARSAMVVEADDLRTAVSAHRWPLYAAEAVEAGVCAAWAYPIQFSAGAFGTVGFYSRQASRLSTEQHHRARAVTELIGLALVDPELGVTVTLGLRMTVHQAAGMVMQQADVSIEEALVLLGLAAFSENARVTELAAEVIAGRRRFGATEVLDE